MTLYDFGMNTAQKRLNMAAILKFKMAAEDAFEKKWNQFRFCLKGYKDAKTLDFISIGNFALTYKISIQVHHVLKKSAKSSPRTCIMCMVCGNILHASFYYSASSSIFQKVAAHFSMGEHPRVLH